MSLNSVEIHVRLLNEGTPTARPAKAELMANGFYRILLTPDYDPEDEEWQFVPGDIVRCEKDDHSWALPVLLAIEKITSL